MKSEVKRSMRRKVSNAIHAYYELSGESFGDTGFCRAIRQIQERIHGNGGDPALRKALGKLADEIMGTVVEGRFAYIPTAMSFRNLAEANAKPRLTRKDRERIRRTWLRHWTEVGVILNHDRWQALQRSRADARAVRKTYKAFTKDAAALAAEPVRDYA